MKLNHYVTDKEKFVEIVKIIVGLKIIIGRENYYSTIFVQSIGGSHIRLYTLV